MTEPGQRIVVPVAALEFVEGGNTIWVHSPSGGTVLRIKTLGTITIDDACTNSVSHADLIVHDSIKFCLVKEDDEQPGPAGQCGAIGWMGLGPFEEP